MDAWHETPTGKPRARGLGILLQGNPGANNAITDVDGVAVGYTTLIEGARARRHGDSAAPTSGTPGAGVRWLPFAQWQW